MCLLHFPGRPLQFQPSYEPLKALVPIASYKLSQISAQFLLDNGLGTFLGQQRHTQMQSFLHSLQVIKSKISRAFGKAETCKRLFWNSLDLPGTSVK